VSKLIPINENSIKKSRNDREIVRKTALQVIRDFNRFGIEIKFPGDLRMAYDELYAQLSPIIQELLNTNLSTVYSILYTVDLNEYKIKKGVAEMPDLELHEVISHLLLDRELRKVLTRDFFSRNM